MQVHKAHGFTLRRFMARKMLLKVIVALMLVQAVLTVIPVALAGEMESALAYIRTSADTSIEEKRRFYHNANRNLGSSALCLSGGAAFGFCA